MKDQSYTEYLMILHNTLMRIETKGESSLLLSDAIRSIREQLQEVNSEQSEPSKN